jgi:serine/threonine protein kinase
MNVMGNDRRTRDEHNDRTMVERIDPLMGTVLDKRYRIDFRLAAGGFGAIYRATHIETGQQYALKVLHAELATSDARVIARFRREGATLAQLKSPNTISAYELGEAPDGSLYIVMELLHGESLYEQFRAKGLLPWERVVAIGRQVCNSLAEAHSLGIIHRDLKPANIHLEGKDGNPDFVKVLDFGIAKIMRESELDSTELTQAGQMIGTFDYMAPEQMVGGQCTGKTDIYTLGVVLYEMVCGQRPFAEAASPTAMLAALLTQSPPPLGIAGVPAELDRILRKCLEREPQNRYDDVMELAADLDRLIAPMHESKTRVMHTPAPVLVDAEATVVAQPRPKRPTPQLPNRQEAVPTYDGRPKRGSEPPAMVHDRPKRDSSPPGPNVIRREPTPPPVLNPSADVRARRESQVAYNQSERPKRDSAPAPHIVRRDRDSQPVPIATKEPAQDPHAWQSLQIPKRDPRESQPAARYDGRDSQPVPVFRDERDGSQPVAQPASQPIPVRPPGSTPAIPHTPAPYVAGQYPVPATPYPNYPGYPQTPAPQLQPTPQPAPLDPRVSLAAIDPNAWRNQTPARGGSYDMAGTQSRDVIVRRVVWTLALVLGVILVLVVASRL